jgi:hypothetical protein
MQLLTALFNIRGECVVAVAVHRLRGVGTAWKRVEGKRRTNFTADMQGSVGRPAASRNVRPFGAKGEPIRAGGFQPGESL